MTHWTVSWWTSKHWLSIFYKEKVDRWVMFVWKWAHLTMPVGTMGVTKEIDTAQNKKQYLCASRYQYFPKGRDFMYRTWHNSLEDRKGSRSYEFPLIRWSGAVRLLVWPAGKSYVHYRMPGKHINEEIFKKETILKFRVFCCRQVCAPAAKRILLRKVS